MTRPTDLLSDKNLARVFLFGIAVAGVFTFASGTPAREVSLIPCPIHELTGVVCPGCGMTRACVALFQAEIATAWDYHPFAFPLVGLAVCFAFFPKRTRRTWQKLAPRLRTTVLSGAILLVLVVWIGRLSG